VLGGAMTAFWLNVVWMMAAQFYWERDQGNLELYFTAPMQHHERALRDGDRRPVHESSRGLVVHLVGTVLYGVVLPSSSGCSCIGVFFLTMAALYGLGMVRPASSCCGDARPGTSRSSCRSRSTSSAA
jgi:ABC-2 type transport system permease protein